MLTVYTQNGCPFCDLAKDLLTARGMEFEVRNIQTDDEARAFVVGEGHRTVPQIYEGDVLYVEGGYEGLKAKLNA